MSQFKFFFQKKFSFLTQYFRSLQNSSPITLWTIFFIATLCFYQHIWIPGYFHDGLIYAALGKNASHFGHWIIPQVSKTYYEKFFEHPPLVFIIEGLFFKIFHPTWITGRLLSCSWAIMIILMIGLFIKKKTNNYWGILTALSFVLLPPFYKKARSPNLDIFLTGFLILGLICYFNAFESKKSKNMYWPLCGIMFGLALLTKGPPAFILPLTIIVHLIFTKKVSKIFALWPWVSLCLGFSIFALWPLILWQEGHFHFFMQYINAQVLTTIVEGRGRDDFLFFTYPYYLLENAGPWFVLSLAAMYKVIKERKDALALLFVSLFLSVVIPFSFVKWKYSNYIVPCFPALAALSCYHFRNIKKSKFNILSFCIKKMALLTSIILLTFPLTTSIKRDREILSIIDINKYFPHQSEQWIVIDKIYSEHSLFPLISWLGKGEVHTLDLQNFIQTFSKNSQQYLNKKSIVLISLDKMNILEQSLKSKFSDIFKKQLYFPRKNMVALFSKGIFQKSPIEEGILTIL